MAAANGTPRHSKKRVGLFHFLILDKVQIWIDVCMNLNITFNLTHFQNGAVISASDEVDIMASI